MGEIWFRSMSRRATWTERAWSLVLLVPAAIVVVGLSCVFRDALGALSAWLPVLLVVLMVVAVLS
jgi:hypothetical protein